MKSTFLYIAQTNGKGRGVFTGSEIEPGTTIEEAPVIVMSAEDRVFLDKTLLHDYIFEWQPAGADLCCMALGWVPVYNHSSQPNCEYFMDYDNQTISIVTLRKVEADEELTFNYNGDADHAPVIWFEEK